MGFYKNGFTVALEYLEFYNKNPSNACLCDFESQPNPLPQGNAKPQENNANR